MKPLDLATQVAGILDEKKAQNINAVKITEISALADYFVIATGTSNTHVKSLSDEVEMRLKAQGVTPANIEGYRSNAWILLDYQSVVVHIFNGEGRDYYDLDRLWRDGEQVALQLTPDSAVADGQSPKT